MRNGRSIGVELKTIVFLICTNVPRCIGHNFQCCMSHKSQGAVNCEEIVIDFKGNWTTLWKGRIGRLMKFNVIIMKSYILYIEKKQYKLGHPILKGVQ